MKTSDEYSGLDECGSGDGRLGRFQFFEVPHMELCTYKDLKIHSIKVLRIGNGAIVDARMRSRT